MTNIQISSDQFTDLFNKIHKYALNSVIDLWDEMSNINPDSKPNVPLVLKADNGNIYSLYVELVDAAYNMEIPENVDIWKSIRDFGIPLLIQSIKLCHIYVKYDKSMDIEYKDLISTNMSIDPINTTMYLEKTNKIRLGFRWVKHN